MENTVSSENLYQLIGVRKSYDRSWALEIDQLSIRRGEVLAIVGPNGAGKSTLLRLLSFLEPLSDGIIRFQDQSVPYPPPLSTRRSTAMVFQRPLMLRGDVLQNVRYGLNIRGLDQVAEVQSLMEQLDLEVVAHVPARTLSGGEIQRVALARALAVNPVALLLDEPTAHLDPYNVGLIESIIQNIHEEGRTTIILVTHNVFQAKRLADRIAMQLGGKILEVGKKSSFFKAPKNPRTMAFIRGEMVY